MVTLGTGNSTTADCRVYVRPEGGHFVGLCAELHAIVTGSTVDDVVVKTKLLAKKARLTLGREAQVAVHLEDSAASTAAV